MRAQHLPTVGVALLCAWASGCGDSPVSARYEAERALWHARGIERRVWTRPEAAGEDIKTSIDAYEALLRDFPLSRVGSVAEERAYLANTRVGASLGLARLYRQERRLGRAVQTLTAARADAADNLELAVTLHAELLQLLGMAPRPDTTLMVLRGLAETVPPASSEGHPIPLVLEAPIREVDLLESMNRATESAERLSSALAYFEKVIQQYQGKEAEVAASVQKAKVEIRLGQYRDAEATLEHAGRLAGAEPYRATILFSQGTLQQQGLRDLPGAIASFRQVVDRFRDSDLAPQAGLNIGSIYVALANPDSALAAFALTETRFPKHPEVQAQARLGSARVYALRREWNEAVRRLRALEADYPRTTAGVLAPLEIAGYFERSGDVRAANQALRDAVKLYEQRVQELAGTQETRSLVMLVLDHQAEAAERLGDWAKLASALLSRAENFPLDPRAPLVFAHAAAVQEEKLNDRAAAIKTLERLIAKYPESPLAIRAQEKIASLKGSS